MKFIIFLICILTTLNVCGQNIHHQMISAQGSSGTTQSGLIVHQTVGQVSFTSSNSGKVSAQQGFQQSTWGVYLSRPKKIAVSTFPNPFTEFINFNLKEFKNSSLSVHIFNTAGKRVYLKEHFIKNNAFTVQLSKLPKGIYLVKLTSKDLNHFTKIIKK
jgi:hypothetical protein